MKVITFGCRLNSYESEVIEGFLKKYDLKDITVINTCGVTKEAERQALQKIRQIKREFVNERILVSGCAAELNHKSFIDLNVDYIVGNDAKLKEETYEKLSKGELPRIVTSNLSKNRDLPLNLVETFNNKAREFAPIQTGCNYACSFCAVREARGPSISFKEEHILKQIKIFAKNYSEVVLTGVNISAYGFDLRPSSSLNKLIISILKNVPELKFLSLSSLDPFTVDDELIDLFKNEERLLPHCHLSIQSGDDKILRAMKRRHSRAKVIDIAKKLHDSNRNITIGADLITGFPGETEDDFQNTFNLIHDAGLDFLHIFPFSRRPGTLAYSMPNQVPKVIAKERALKLRDEINKKFFEYLKTYIGKTIKFFRENEQNGRSFNFIEVISDENLSSFNSNILEGTVMGIRDLKLVVANVR